MIMYTVVGHQAEWCDYSSSNIVGDKLHLFKTEEEAEAEIKRLTIFVEEEVERLLLTDDDDNNYDELKNLGYDNEEGEITTQYVVMPVDLGTLNVCAC